MKNQQEKTVELDVRPYLRKKQEPFPVIMETVKKLKEDQMFKLHATFKPTPLLEVMKTKGFVYQIEKKAKDHWIVTFVNKKNKHLFPETFGEPVDEEGEWADEDHITSSPEDNGPSSMTSTETEMNQPSGGPQIVKLDNRGLEPPQPMLRTLAALERICPGDEVHIHNDQVPVFLLDELNQLGYPFTVDVQPDGSAKVKITKK